MRLWRMARIPSIPGLELESATLPLYQSLKKHHFTIMKKIRTGLLLLACLAMIGAASCGKIKKGEYAKGSATIFCDDGFKNIL